MSRDSNCSGKSPWLFCAPRPVALQRISCFAGYKFNEMSDVKASPSLTARLKHIKLFLCDVDDVLTDGSNFIGGILDCGGKRSATPLSPDIFDHETHELHEMKNKQSGSSFFRVLRGSPPKRCRGSRLATAVHDVHL
jgi:hypothetical protein